MKNRKRRSRRGLVVGLSFGGVVILGGVGVLVWWLLKPKPKTKEELMIEDFNTRLDQLSAPFLSAKVVTQ